jgi:cobalamin biosynthesis protein CobW
MTTPDDTGTRPAAPSADTQTTKIPTTVITGFLGAGKTSMIRHLLENAGGKRLALVINEFGDLGVDGEILKGCGIEGCSDDDVLELANGCICCTVADDFLPTMEKLVNRAQTPDHIVIETSGLALPKPLVQAFGWPEVRTRATVDGVVAVIDAPAVADGLFTSRPDQVQALRESDPALDHESPLEEVFEDQINCADIVVLNKTDLLSAHALGTVVADIKAKLRPGTKLLRSAHGAVDPEVMLGLGSSVEDDLAGRPSHHDGEEEHDHDDFETFAIDFDEPKSPQEIVGRIQPALEAHGILRVKGFASVAGKPMRLVLQGVGGRLQHYYDRELRQDEPRGGRLVVIGETGLDRAAIAAAVTGRA